MKISTNWLKDFVAVRGDLNALADDLTMAGLEIKKSDKVDSAKDTVFDIEITTNRPDWLSHWGVAREIAAVRDVVLKPAFKKPVVRQSPVTDWRVVLESQKDCPYYVGVHIEDVRPGPTPRFMKDRLEACGMRSINLLVDITNYVLLEFGQPLHIFDADRLSGKRVIVRRAVKGEIFVAIDGKKLELTTEDLVIADGAGPIALAGIMGGKDSEVQDGTCNLFLESAYFDPRTVRRSSLRHTIKSESSYRFERRVDPEFVSLASQRALALICQYAKPRRVSKYIVAGKLPKASAKAIRFSAGDIPRSLGISLKDQEIVKIFKRLGLPSRRIAAGQFLVNAPSFRADLQRPIDLVEEVARIYGFDRIPETLPAGTLLYHEENPRLQVENEARHLLTGAGLNEVVTFSLVSEQGLDPELHLKDAVKIVNPQNRQLKYMRPTLVTSLMNVIQKNFRVGEDRVALFEIANLYRKNGEAGHPEEERTLGLALCGKWRRGSWQDEERDASFYDIKGVVELLIRRCGVQDVEFRAATHPGLSKVGSEAVFCGASKVGFLGEVSSEMLQSWGLESSVYVAELGLDTLTEKSQWIRPVDELPRYPSITRDLAVVVSDSVKAGRIEERIRQMEQTLIRRVELFDLFEGGRIPKGHRNLAFRLTYQSPDKTLISEDIQQLHTSIADRIAKEFGASFQ